MQKLRDYQVEAVSSVIDEDRNGLLVLPTGSGKSHVIAGIVNSIPGKSIILQPTKEILESNLDKIQSSGIGDIGVYSASMGMKRLERVTYATVRSIIKIKEQLNDIQALIIDEAHLTNAQGGQYLEFIRELEPKILIGLTATPYRLGTNSFGSQMKMLTRTRPKIFKNIPHITQTRDLVDRGHLHEPEYLVSGQDQRMMFQSNTLTF